MDPHMHNFFDIQERNENEFHVEDMEKYLEETLRHWDEKDREIDQYNEQIFNFENHEDEIQSLGLLRIQEQMLKTKMLELEQKLSNLNEEETSLQISLGRIQSDYEITNHLIEQEKEKTQKIREIDKMVDDQIQKQKQSNENPQFQNSIVTNEHQINTAITYNNFKFQNTTLQSYEKLKNLTEKVNQLEGENRNIFIEKSHIIEMYKQRINYEEKWKRDKETILNQNDQDIENLKQEIKNLKLKEKEIERKYHFKQNEDGVFLMKSLEKVISVLKGRTELPNGKYLKVSAAINYYTKLKEAAESNEFTVEFFKNFLKEHKEFGIFVCSYEELPALQFSDVQNHDIVGCIAP